MVAHTNARSGNLEIQCNQKDWQDISPLKSGWSQFQFMSITLCLKNIKMVAHTKTKCGYLEINFNQNDWQYKLSLKRG